MPSNHIWPRRTMVAKSISNICWCLVGVLSPPLIDNLIKLFNICIYFRKLLYLWISTWFFKAFRVRHPSPCPLLYVPPHPPHLILLFYFLLYLSLTLYFIYPPLGGSSPPPSSLTTYLTSVDILNETHLSKAYKLTSTHKREHALFVVLGLGFLTQYNCF